MSERKRLRAASNSTLPLASVIPDEEIFQEVRTLLKQATANKVKIDELEDKQNQIKDKLMTVCEAYDLPGFRIGLNMCEYQPWHTRRTLSKERLLANGVSAEIIAASEIESKPFRSIKIDPFDIE